MRSRSTFLTRIRPMLCAAPACLLAPAVLTTSVSVSSPVMAAPQPEPIPRRWQLEFEPGALRLAMIPTESGAIQAYYYLTYYVENNTGQDLIFAPSFELATDDGEIRRSGIGVPASVTKQLLERLRNPFLLDQISAVGLLLQGEENAREALVVWPADNLEVDEILIFAAGFSGETTTLTRPDTGEPVLLRKTMMLRYETPGALTGLGDRPIQRAEQRWIMR